MKQQQADYQVVPYPKYRRFMAAAGGGELPPFHGVPFTVKENIDLAGTPTTEGAKALADAYPRLDAPVVERLKAAGAIPIGRTNCPTFTLRWHCESELWGRRWWEWDAYRSEHGASVGREITSPTRLKQSCLARQSRLSLSSYARPIRSPMFIAMCHLS